MLAVGCVPGIPEPEVTETTSAEAAAIAAAREGLAEPTQALAALTLDAARRVDFLRHEVARGPAMRQAAVDLAAVVAELDASAGALEAAVAEVDPILEMTQEAATALVTEARGVSSAASAAVGDLLPVMDLDDRMAEVVEGWDDRGSRSEAAERLTALVAQAEEVLRQARRLSVPPAVCTGVRDNRLRWARELVERSERLRDLALAADGPGYDSLRAQYDAAPYGEDRAAADAESRSCWADRTGLLSVDAEVALRLAALEGALAG